MPVLNFYVKDSDLAAFFNKHPEISLKDWFHKVFAEAIKKNGV